ncbi:hypothetical protein N0V90_001213 [Kalmusia sp. IMI 367209]|nr:hypothetical protein N0V90_001213 [Kalmusia sp. IMI 367209]
MAPVPKNGLVLVTGANGYLGSITVQTLLSSGYRVRGSVRDSSKHEWMLSHYGPKFELVSIPDVSLPGAFDEAIKGIDGVAHIAASTPNPEDKIMSEINALMNLFEAAQKEKSVKRITYTSSQAACVKHYPGAEYHIDQSTYYEDAKQAWTLPMSPDWPRCFLNYCCKKVEGEQRGFKWVAENKPHFEFNTVVPNVCWGTMVRPDIMGFTSTSKMLKWFWEGQKMVVDLCPPMWYVDVEDQALLQVAALTESDVINERLLAFGEKFTYNEILDIFRKQCPGRKFLDNVEEVPDRGTVDTKRSVELLKRAGKKEGFSTLEEVLRKWIPWILKAEEEGWVDGDRS